MTSAIRTGHKSQIGTRSYTGELLSATWDSVINKAAVAVEAHLRPPLHLGPPQARAFEPDPEPEPVSRGRWEDRFLWKKVFGEGDAAFESFFSSVAQRRQLCW